MEDKDQLNGEHEASNENDTSPVRALNRADILLELKQDDGRNRLQALD